MDQFFKYREYIVYAAAARLKSEVSNSYLNWIWWILEPLLNMIVYVLVFGYIFKMSEAYFPLFLFVGISMWNFFAKSVTGSVGLIRRNRSVITKVYIPKTVLLSKDILVNFFKMLLSFLIIAIMMIVYRVSIGINIFMAVPVLFILILFTYGVSCFFLHYGVYYEDLEYIISVILNIIMYFTGVFYSISRFVPGLPGIILSNANPMAFLITSMRNSLIYRRAVRADILLAVFIVSIFLAVLGTAVIKKNENNYVKVR